MTTGTRLREAREAKGFDLEDVPFLLKQTIGKRAAKSRETLRKIERDEIPESEIPNEVVVGLAEVYDRRLVDLVSAEKLAEIENLRDMVIRRSSCKTKFARQPVAA